MSPLYDQACSSESFEVTLCFQVKAMMLSEAWLFRARIEWSKYLGIESFLEKMIFWPLIGLAIVSAVQKKDEIWPRNKTSALFQLLPKKTWETAGTNQTHVIYQNSSGHEEITPVESYRLKPSRIKSKRLKMLPRNLSSLIQDDMKEIKQILDNLLRKANETRREVELRLDKIRNLTLSSP